MALSQGAPCFPIRISNSQTVIASAAKQSISPRKGRMDCFVAYAPRNDGETQFRIPAVRRLNLLISPNAARRSIRCLCNPRIVIASEAKQSMAPPAERWIASSLSLLAMTMWR
jgi:hypothetical protein